MNRYPHTGTLRYYGAQTVDTQGVYTEGTLNSLAVHCNVQPNKANLVIAVDGVNIHYQYDVYAPLVTVAINPDIVRFDFQGQTYKAKLFNYQKHTELRVWV